MTEYTEAEEVIKEYPEHSTSLAQALQRNAELWANLKITLSSQGSTLVKIYRAIIFSEGCEELMEWLGKASLKIFSIARSHHLGQKGTAFEILLDLNQEPHQAAQSFLRSRLSTSLKRSASDTCVIFLPEKPLDHSDKCDLSNISSSLSKVTDLNVQLNNKWIFFKELQEHFQHFLHDQSNFMKNESQLAAVSSKFTGIQQKINACLADLTAQHNVINALRMLAGETAWLEERRAQIKWDLVGSLLLETEKLLLRHHNFAKEVAIRKLRGQPIIAKVLTWIQLAEATKEAAAPQERNEDRECAILLAHTPHLLVELMDRVSRLLWMQCLVETKLHSRYDTLEHWRSFFSHQIDLIETYNWLAETESAVMTESHASSGVASARAAIIKHSFVENTISTLQASRVRSLGQKTCQLLATIKHRMRLNKERLSALKRVSQDLPAESGQSEAAKRRRHQLRRCIHALERSATKMLTSQQSLQRQFKDLLDLVWEKKHRLRELLALNRLYEDVADLEEWMSAQTREALICQTGRDLDECSRMQRQFGQLQRRVLGPEPDVTGQLIEASFDRRPELRLSQSAACAELATAGALPPLPDGPEKLLRAIQTCRQLIALRHSDSPRIALWQGRLAEDWQDLRELLNTRGELLRAAGNRLLFFRRCEDVTQDLLDKLTLLPSIIGPDKETLDKQQRQLASFQWDIEAMGEGVNWVLMATEVLLPQFAGEQAEEMKTKKQRMLDVWQKLNQTMEQHHRLLTEASALDKWLADWMHFLNWAMLTRKKP
uniref:Uncharacterized protein n=1 Tax=Schistocephalus solidus TaxID=70667 RepID=A0A0V0J8D2_SCHSO